MTSKLWQAGTDQRFIRCNQGSGRSAKSGALTAARSSSRRCRAAAGRPVKAAAARRPHSASLKACLCSAAASALPGSLREDHRQRQLRRRVSLCRHLHLQAELRSSPESCSWWQMRSGGAPSALLLHTRQPSPALNEARGAASPVAQREVMKQSIPAISTLRQQISVS